ncbi:hypothetical protein CORC01_01774 [Colletotrichum orchidophilum]|uniref:MmgE/PrpD family protein n=1 Tax=Colletotrichum orchidophilum TaxID=1209926 RepID=A0A1G4BNZ7_9PEZI|nr:uncharacterized protein CORC01_01774 [Colletotrichum orchidophilum]OHF03016.1 hypothetical protein CORC01_01774 [Colletotrichum orchidophilum]
MATLNTAKWIASLTFDELPERVVEAAVRSFYTWVTCAVEGSSHPTTLKAYKALSPFFGKGTSSVLGFNHRIDAQNAALINGIASHVHDFEDAHLIMTLHPTGCVASALLSFAETLQRPVTGKEFITALVAGIEVECKIARAVFPEHYYVGLHITSTIGSVGAAAAIAKLLALPAEQTAHAIGIATTQVTGLRETFSSDTKSFHVGRVAQDGLLAAVLPAEGFTSSLRWLETLGSYIKSNGEEHQLDYYVRCLVSGSGKWEMEKNPFKPFPYYIDIHPVIRGAVWLHHELERRGISTDEVASVDIKVHAYALRLTDVRTPKDGLEAEFSLHHGAAVGLLFGSATVAEYQDDVVNSAAVVALRDRIEADFDEAIERDECHLVVKFLRGEDPIEKHVDRALGSVEVPMSDVQLTEKFITQAGLQDGSEKALMASKWCWRVVESADMRELGYYLRNIHDSTLRYQCYT